MPASSPEWLAEDGIGEHRRVLVADGCIVQAHLLRDDGRPRAGAIVDGRIGRRLANGRAEVRIGGEPAILQHAPAGLTEGAAIRLRIVREPIPERGEWRPALATPAAPDEAPTTLDDIIRDSGLPVRTGPDTAARIEAAGWHELVEEARGDDIAFPGGRLRLAVTPAMTLFDVDGDGDVVSLAAAGAAAAGLAIRRLDIGGSIGIDLPTIDRVHRMSVAAALDAVLPQPFERTGVNGFGFLQVVRRRTRASLPELMQGDAPHAAALALLRAGQRARGAGRRTLVAHPRVMRHLRDRADWLRALEVRIGAGVWWREDAALPIWGGHVETEHP